MPIGLEDRLINNASGFSIAGAIDNDIRGIYWVATTGDRDLIGDANVNNSDLRAQYVICIVGSTPYIYTSASIADVDWTNTANWQEFALGDLAALTTQVNTNAGNISTNSSAISNNASGISTNAGDIATNAGDISTNAGAISTNAGDIATLQGDLAQEVLDRQSEDSSLLGQIQSNDTDIGNNTAAINTNAGNISANTTAIAAIVSADGSINTHSDVDTASTLPETGQVLFWNGLNWVPEYPEVTVEVKNATATNFTKGQPVYVSGTAASGKPEVELADNDGTNTYPAIGLLYDDINAGDEGLVVISGSIFGVDTISYTAGDSLYIDSTPGALTDVKPDGTSQIQKVALVKRSHATAGSLIVMGAGRVNDLPNLPTGQYWRGSSNGVPQAQSFDTDVTNSSQVQLNISAISTNAGNITTNATDISTNAGDIATNTSAIATNASDISTLQTNTTGNLTGSVTVHSDVTSAGSGAIITINERTKLNAALVPGDNVSGLANDASYITAAQAPVQSVNTQQGAVTLDADDIDDSTTTHKFTTAADITKLAGIETAATADQTDAEIKTAYENNNDTNAFTDAEQTKLAGIDSGATANQTDAHLLDRTNHTGTQDVATITGLATVATSGDSTDLIDSADLIRDTNTISDLAFTTQPGTGTVPYLGGAGWIGAVVMQSITFTPTTGINVSGSGQSPTLLLTSSDNSVTITGSASTLDFTATGGGGGSSNQRTLTVPTGNGYSGDVVTFGSAPSGGFTVGELYYFATTGAWEEAYGTAVNTSAGLLGICVNTSTPEILIRGIIRSSTYANQFSLGRRLYVSTLQGGSGRLMDSVPSSPPSGAVIRAAGFVTDAVNGVIMFDPSQDYITVT